MNASRQQLLAGLLLGSLALAACRARVDRPQPTVSPLPRVTATATATATPRPTATPTHVPTAMLLPAVQIMLCAFSHSAPNYHIWVMRADGAEQRLLAPDVLAATHPSWAPDSKHVVFAGFQENRNALFIADVGVEDGAPRRLTDAPTSVDSNPFWSPSGDWIAFSRYDAH